MAPFTPKNPPPLFWAVQSLHPHDSISPHQCTDHCPQGLAHPGKGSSNTCPAAAAAAKSLQSCPDSVRPHRLAAQQAPLSMGFSGKNTGVGCHFLLQGIFPTQESNPGLPHCRQTQADALNSEPPGSLVKVHKALIRLARGLMSMSKLSQSLFHFNKTLLHKRS